MSSLFFLDTPQTSADFILINLAATPLQTLRQSTAQTLAEKLFALMILGDEYNIARVYIMGKQMFQRAGSA